MSRDEEALAAKGGPSFADLCWKVREARRVEIRAVQHEEACRQALEAAKVATTKAHDDVDDARDDLDTFIERECAE